MTARKKKRRMYRLKNFQSQRLAQRHGEALGAHARGQPKVAIEMLKQLAKACHLYTSDAADEEESVDLGSRRTLVI